MNLKTAEKIIDDLTKGKEKLRVKKVNNDSIFIKYGSLTFLCDFELKKLEFVFKTDVPITSPTPAKEKGFAPNLDEVNYETAKQLTELNKKN